jgi:hypothetical protein
LTVPPLSPLWLLCLANFLMDVCGWLGTQVLTHLSLSLLHPCFGQNRTGKTWRKKQPNNILQCNSPANRDLYKLNSCFHFFLARVVISDHNSRAAKSRGSRLRS